MNKDKALILDACCGGKMFYEDNKFKLCNYNTGLILCYDTYLELKEAAETYFMNNFISSVKD